jgi:hypothetical protein
LHRRRRTLETYRIHFSRSGTISIDGIEHGELTH